MGVNRPEDWEEKYLKAMLERDAASHFKPAKEVAHFLTNKSEHTIVCQVWWEGVDSWAWTTMKMTNSILMHTMRSGYEQTREAAMLASYNAAKELAGE
jgi:hypothetical protein